MSGRWTCRSAGRVDDRRAVLGWTLASNGSRGVDLVCGIAVYELVRAALTGGGKMVSKVADIGILVDCRRVPAHGRQVFHNMVILDDGAVVMGGVRRNQHYMGLS